MPSKVRRPAGSVRSPTDDLGAVESPVPPPAGTGCTAGQKSMRENCRLRRGIVAVAYLPSKHDPTVPARGEGSGAMCEEWRGIALMSEEERPSVGSGVELRGGTRW